MNQLTIFCLVLGVVSWYYFNKFQDSEKEYNKLYKRFEQVYIENQKVKSRIKDLQSYKNDVSKTFKILDNELVMINDHLKKQNENVTPERQRPPLPPRPPAARSFYMRNIPNDNVSLLTPDLLTSLFNMNTFTDVVDTLPIANPSVRQGTLSMANPSVRQGIVSLFQESVQQEQEQESVQQQQQQEQEELALISKEQESVQQQQELALISKEQQQDTVKLDLNIDIDKIGRSDILSGNGDNYDRYII